MGDALIVGRGGGGSSSGGSSGKTLVTKIIQATQSWVVPKAKDQKFYVRIFGGGGGGSYGIYIDPNEVSYNQAIISGGGGGGMMNNGELTLESGTSIPITIGKGGTACSSGDGSVNGGNGGTTSFGTYLAANGGQGGISTKGRSWYYSENGSGGNGGSGGGGYIGGNGYQFGAGGGQFLSLGGYWGGGSRGPGGSSKHPANGIIFNFSTLAPEKDSTGEYATSGLNGINTIGNDQIPNGSEDRPYYELNLQGNGTSYSNGFGGHGGNGASGNYGGGGGYGGDGGIGTSGSSGSNDYNVGGGGGGYGADGGNAYIDRSSTRKYVFVACGGGGGGYGTSGTGGSQYTGFQDGGIAAGGAGGGHVTADITNEDHLVAAGKGGNGICIIQYYA